jgi:hypothetical protein
MWLLCAVMIVIWSAHCCVVMSISILVMHDWFMLHNSDTLVLDYRINNYYRFRLLFALMAACNLGSSFSCNHCVVCAFFRCFFVWIWSMNLSTFIISVFFYVSLRFCAVLIDSITCHGRCVRSLISVCIMCTGYYQNNPRLENIYT